MFTFYWVWLKRQLEGRLIAYRTNRSHACFDSCRCVKSASSNQTKKNTGWETENYAQSFHSFKAHTESFLTSKYKIIFFFRDLLVVPLRACICICMVNKKRISTERNVLFWCVSERVRTFPVTCQCFVRTLLPKLFFSDEHPRNYLPCSNTLFELWIRCYSSLCTTNTHNVYILRILLCIFKASVVF